VCCFQLSRVEQLLLLTGRFILIMNNPGFQSLQGLRVLVVEDNLINQRLFMRILMQWQVTTDLAANGRIALDLLTKNVYDVVLMDIMMPELDGYDVTRAIRAMDGDYFHNLPIYAFSSCPDPERILECEMNGQITKSPPDREELYQTISSYRK